MAGESRARPIYSAEDADRDRLVSVWHAINQIGCRPNRARVDRSDNACTLVTDENSSRGRRNLCALQSSRANSSMCIIIKAAASSPSATAAMHDPHSRDELPAIAAREFPRYALIFLVGARSTYNYFAKHTHTVSLRISQMRHSHTYKSVSSETM